MLSYHGTTVDLARKYYEPREITLSCFIRANSKEDFTTKLTTFEHIFDKPGTNRLVIEANPERPLIYEVFCKDEISVTKKWREGPMAGSFKLKLTEHEPVKRIFRFRATVGNMPRNCGR